jgi:ketosteroid isomerase-like protein
VTLDALKRYFRALRTKDLQALQTLMTDDVVTEIPFGESGKTDEGSFRVYRGMDRYLISGRPPSRRKARATE